MPNLLQELGGAIKVARQQRKPVMTQQDLAKELGKTDSDGNGLQSFVTRLEQGKIADPPVELIDDLARIFKLPREYLVALIVEDKYRIDRARLMPLHRSPMGLADLAHWETSPDHEELWIVTPRFADQDDKVLQDAMIQFVKRGGKVVFFTSVAEVVHFNNYKLQVEELTSDASIDINENFKAIYLNEDETSVMVASYVIAFPKAERANPLGYKVLSNDSGHPVVALKLSEDQIRRKVTALIGLRARKVKQSLTSETFRPTKGEGLA